MTLDSLGAAVAFALCGVVDVAVTTVLLVMRVCVLVLQSFRADSPFPYGSITHIT